MWSNKCPLGMQMPAQLCGFQSQSCHLHHLGLHLTGIFFAKHAYVTPGTLHMRTARNYSVYRHIEVDQIIRRAVTIEMHTQYRVIMLILFK